MKKFLALALSVTMIMGMSVTAFAGSDTSKSLDIGSEVEVATIAVTVPESPASFTINPYGLAVDESTATVITTDHLIQNTGDTAVQVSATVTGVLNEAGNAMFATADFSSKAPTTKSIYLWATLGDAAADQVYNGSEPFDWTNDAYNSKEDLVISTKEAALKKTVVLDKVDASGNVYTAFHLDGIANGQATEAWTANDTATVKVVFNFLPTTYTAAE